MRAEFNFAFPANEPMETFEKTVTLIFANDLIELLPRSRRNSPVVYSFNGPQSIKHLVESLGIPHTEIGGILLGGAQVSSSYLVKDGDQIDVHSAEHTESYGARPEFVADGHLGRLAAGLRMLGMDCAYRSNLEDSELVQLSLSDSRHLLTRDRQLLMHKELTRGYLVRALEPAAQLPEVVERFKLSAWLRPLTRCIRCNHLLRPVEKATVLHQLEPLTRLYFEDFHQCSGCGQLYWRGSHVAKMLDTIRGTSSGTTQGDVDAMDF